ncbi:MAG: hypothetical protein AB8H79_10705, partial [Myxococcota bacterium]
DPHDGLALFGPHSAGTSSHPTTPAYILIGSPEGTDAFRAWAAAMNRPAAHPSLKKHRLWPPYPGFEVAFGSRWAEDPTLTYTVDRKKLLEASRKKDPHERTYAVVEQLLPAFARLRKIDERVAVAICVVPDELWLNCRPESRVASPSDSGISKSEKALRQRGQTSMFDRYDLDQYRLSPDLRRQLKARTMKFDVPVQLIRESTLRLTTVPRLGERSLTPLSDRMWNLGTALYFKSGGKPWKLKSAREGVCYVGIAFRRAPEGGTTACCAAQMFLDSGDGVVFLGEYGPWYSEKDRQFRLTRGASKKLIAGILETYSELDGRPLKELFVHCRSSLSREEFEGFEQAAPAGCKVVVVRVRPERLGPRLFRYGTRPVLRGTFLKEHGRAGLLYASGFKPRLATYDGWETPVPLHLLVQYGEAPVEQVAQDILGLTKLNYNACKLGDGQPVTVKFSDAVGEILISNPTVTERRHSFKFYI